MTLEKIKSILYFLVFLILFVTLLRFLLLKPKFHLKLLKKLYPYKLANVNSIYNPLIGMFIMDLGFPTFLWFFTPIFYSYLNINNLAKDELELVIKLKSNNKKFLLSLFVFLIWLFIGGVFLESK